MSRKPPAFPFSFRSNLLADPSPWIIFFPPIPSSYVTGDFILHFAGKKGRVRQSLVDHYYPLAMQVRYSDAEHW